MRNGRPERLLLPDSAQIAGAVRVMQPLNADRRIRLVGRGGSLLHVCELGEVGWNTRVVLWRGRAFMHWQDTEWREVPAVRVGQGGNGR